MGRNERSLRLKFRKITILPLIIFGILTVISSSFLIYNAMRSESEDGLRNLSHALYRICESSNQGDYSLQNHILYKGNQPFDPTHEIVDDIKDTSGIDATVFWGSTRMSTTIRNDDGERTLGSASSPEVQKAVLKEGKEYFSDNVFVNKVPYFGQYMPLKNSDDTIVGMIFVGKPRTLVLHTIYKVIGTISVILLLMIFLVSTISLSFSGKIIDSLNATKEFLSRITKGDVDTPIQTSVLDRDDEIGEMGRFSVMLQKSVTELINTDTLTGLYNRRSCTLFLESAVKDFEDNQTPFTLVIGDIDDFKIINDTYGHGIGDEVLKNISAIFKKHLDRNSFVARWGGEEFLFIFKHMNEEQTCKQLLRLQHHISHMKCPTLASCNIKVTMTFGVSEYHSATDLEQLLKNADDKLYIGKANGKNKVICSD
ncbi:MAG: diguanylate cyclase [Longicatena sp.]